MYFLYQNNFIIFILITLLLIVIFGGYITPNYVFPISKINKQKKIAYTTIKTVFIILVGFFFINIKLENYKKVFDESQANIQIIWDVSLSLTVNDITPNRFEASKNAISEFVGGLSGFDLSIITFSGKPILRVPFSKNTEIIRQKINQTDLREFAPHQDFVGTNIGDALLFGIDNLITKPTSVKKNNIIILITDGSNQDGISIEKVTEVLQKANIKVISIGIGNQSTLVGIDKSGEEVFAEIDLESLKELSDKTNGLFYNVNSNYEIQSILSDIQNMIKFQKEKKVVTYYYYLNDCIIWIITFLGMFLILRQTKAYINKKQ